MSPTKKRAITTKVNGDKAGKKKENKDDEVVLTRYDHNVNGFFENGCSNVLFEGDGMSDIALDINTLHEGID